jgi:flavin reductase (DIM6/NTAB) family NADH-FMN oxidoreductase RutF
VHGETVATQPSNAPLEPERFREALARWASGVAVVAVREEGRVLATTVTALLSVSLEPPLVLVSLGGTAQVLPFLTPDRSFAISVLAEDQGRIASVFADAYPAGAPAFAPRGDPWVEGALVRLGCRVDRIDPVADHHLVLALVETADVDEGRPLVRYLRAYRPLADCEP